MGLRPTVRFGLAFALTLAYVAFGVYSVDRFTPAMAIDKEIDLRFVLAYTPLEFRDTLHMMGQGKIDPRPLITGTVGLEGVDAAFSAAVRPR